MGISVLLDWVTNLTLKQQTVLLTAIRGSDSTPKNNPSKVVTRHLRSLILRNADPSTTFMIKESLKENFETMLKDIDHYPLHYILHLIHATEILGYKHPNDYIKNEWCQMYKEACLNFHMNPETEKQLDVRLSL